MDQNWKTAVIAGGGGGVGGVPTSVAQEDRADRHLHGTWQDGM